MTTVTVTKDTMRVWLQPRTWISAAAMVLVGVILAEIKTIAGALLLKPGEASCAESTISSWTGAGWLSTLAVASLALALLVRLVISLMREE